MAVLFGFDLSTRIEVGEGRISSVGRLAREVTVGKKAFVVTDPGIVKAGITEKVLKSLKDEGYSCAVFTAVQPNPKDKDCEKGGAEAARFGAEVIVAVGGGSVIDSAKAIALLQTHGGALREYEGRGKVSKTVTPIVAVPTTAGTGSEVTRSAVITDTARKFKMTIKDLLLAPRVAVVDPETTYGLSSALTATTGMDALVHAIEAFTCKAANPMSDLFALSAMEKIYAALPAAVEDGHNRRARYDLMVGSLWAGIAFSHSDVAAVHCMAEALGGLYDTPHGVANSMFLPVVTAYNASADPQKHAQAAAACGLDIAGLSAIEAADYLIEQLTILSERIGIPKFSDLSYVREQDLQSLSEAAAINGSTPSNCRSISEAAYLQLFKSAKAK